MSRLDLPKTIGKDRGFSVTMTGHGDPSSQSSLSKRGRTRIVLLNINLVWKLWYDENVPFHYSDYVTQVVLSEYQTRTFIQGNRLMLQSDWPGTRKKKNNISNRISKGEIIVQNDFHIWMARTPTAVQ